MAKRLTLRQHNFVMAILIFHNATAAAIAAGYAEKSAHVEGCRLLRNANVLRELERQRKELEKTSGTSKEEIAAHYRREMHNYGPDATPSSRNDAAWKLSRLLGYDRYVVTLETEGAPTPREALAEMMKALTNTQLKNWREILETMRAAQTKVIEHAPE